MVAIREEGWEMGRSERDLDEYRSWLHLLARLQIDSLYQGKFDASDIVQQTLLEAHRGAERFRGESQLEYMGWLRGILGNVLAHQLRRYCGTQARQIDREVSLQQSLAVSSRQLDQFLMDSGPSPSRVTMEREQALLLAEALDRLPADYREVIVLRNLEGLSHDEVARRLNRSSGAVRMLWLRALKLLREQLPAP